MGVGLSSPVDESTKRELEDLTRAMLGAFPLVGAEKKENRRTRIHSSTFLRRVLICNAV